MPAMHYRTVFKEILGEILTVPIWWYSGGALRALERCRVRIRDANDYLGFMVWFKNLLVPMYGQYDTVGRLISVGIRLIQIMVRGVILLIVVVLAIALFIAYLVLPLLVFIEIVIQWVRLS